jgi:hypothetical protein
MKKITNPTGSKAVNLISDANGNINAHYVQIYKGEEQVLEAKTFRSAKNAMNWANKKIS